MDSPHRSDTEEDAEASRVSARRAVIRWSHLRTALRQCGGEATLFDLTRWWLRAGQPGSGHSPETYRHAYLQIHELVTDLARATDRVTYDETTGKVFLTDREPPRTGRSPPGDLQRRRS